MDDNGERYGLLCREIAVTVIHMYSMDQTKNQVETMPKVVISVERKYAQRPIENRTKES